MIALTDANAALIGATVVLLCIVWLLRRLERIRQEQSRPLVPMQSHEVYGAGQFGHRTDDVADAYIRAADAEALLAMEQRRIMAEKWRAQQAAGRTARPVATPDVETLEAWYARQPAPRKELGR